MNLENWYEDQFREEGMPDFRELTKEQKRRLNECMGFTIYQAVMAVRAFKQAIRKAGLQILRK